MASAMSFVSRRKQAKPQRVGDFDPSLVPGELCSEDMEMDEGRMTPMDLSTKKGNILEDRSNFLQSLAIASPQQLLSLCAQLARNEGPKSSLAEALSDSLAGQSGPLTGSNSGSLAGPPSGPPPASLSDALSNSFLLPTSQPASVPSSFSGPFPGPFGLPGFPAGFPMSMPSLMATPPQDTKTVSCPSSSCGMKLSSRGSQLWHVMERHSEEKLLRCDRCDERFADRDQIAEHECLVEPRPMSLDGAQDDMPDFDRGSVPADLHSHFILVEDTNPMMSPGDLSFLFSDRKPFQSHPSHLFPSMPFPPHPPFFLRPPFDGRSDLFPRPDGNPEDDWEALMEVSTSNEAEKIRLLVGDQAQPTTDPNQCILCRRVLSCKSALQMHYRTHTGERPFKCKICQRAFTTKGNLKTHMGVHRAKHSFRGMFHPMPMLQVPMSLPMGMGLPQGMNPNMHHGLPPGLPQGFPHALSHSHGLPGHSQGLPHGMPHSHGGPPHPQGFPQGLPMMGGPSPSMPALQPSQQCPICQKRFMTASQLQNHIAEHTQALTGRAPQAPPTPHNFSCSTPPTSFSSPFPGGMFPFFPPTSMSFPHSEPHTPLNTGFSLSQLLGKQATTEEIRVKTEPNEKDNECFSQSNMPEEMLSPPVKVDVRAAVVDATSPSGSSDHSAEQQHDHTDGSSVSRSESDGEKSRAPSAIDATRRDIASLLDAEFMTRRDVTPSMEIDQKLPLLDADQKAQECENPFIKMENPLEAMQKMWAETEPPPPRQLPVLSKHQCAVCFKHFSSSSALQIHMRTHTGDKPFKCDVCGRAFTTRGNLKVHMGTHLWQQSPSRRGRRIFDVNDPSMSLPSPLPLFPPVMPNVEMMMMLWRTVCSVCQKVCASPTELEQHLKEHLNGSMPSRDSESPPQTAQETA